MWSFNPFVFCLLMLLAFATGLPIAFLLGHRTAERAAGDERDELVRFYSSREIENAAQKGRDSDRWLGLLADVAEKAEDNLRLVKDFEDNWEAQPAEHHRGKAAAYRDILIRYRGL